MKNEALLSVAEWRLLSSFFCKESSPFSCIKMKFEVLTSPTFGNISTFFQVPDIAIVFKEL